MDKKLIYDSEALEITLTRLCFQLVENYNSFSNAVVLGLQPRGVNLAKRLHAVLGMKFGVNPPLGFVDTTFNRDDFRKRELDIIPNAMQVPFSLEGKNVILVDDVLYTGRSVRAGIDAMLAFGRPSKIELLILINRKYTRELPIEPKYVGKNVNTMANEKVLVDLTDKPNNNDAVWLISKT